MVINAKDKKRSCIDTMKKLNKHPRLMKQVATHLKKMVVNKIKFVRKYKNYKKNMSNEFGNEDGSNKKDILNTEENNNNNNNNNYNNETTNNETKDTKTKDNVLQENNSLDKDIELYQDNNGNLKCFSNLNNLSNKNNYQTSKNNNNNNNNNNSNNYEKVINETKIINLEARK